MALLNTKSNLPTKVTPALIDGQKTNS